MVPFQQSPKYLLNKSFIQLLNNRHDSSNAPHLEGLYQKCEEKKKRITKLCETMLKFWYRTDPEFVKEAELDQVYGKLYSDFKNDIDEIKADLPDFVQSILKEEDQFQTNLEQSLSFDSPIKKIITKTDLRIQWLKGYLYWLSMVQTSLALKEN